MSGSESLIEQFQSRPLFEYAHVTLPPLPQVASKILLLRQNGAKDVGRLVALIEVDPCLAGQVMHCARSVFFGYRGKVTTVAQAVTRVLGFDKTLNLAVALALGQSLRHDIDGPLGLRWFWRHALLTATLTQTLAGTLPVIDGLDPGTAYLSGLLHDIGYLYMGHASAAQFKELNRRWDETEPKQRAELEKRLFRSIHFEISTWLLRQWRLPGEVLAAAYQHHNSEYHGEAWPYARLIFIAERFSGGEFVSEDDYAFTRACTTLSLNPEEVRAIAASTIERYTSDDALTEALINATP